MEPTANYPDGDTPAAPLPLSGAQATDPALNPPEWNLVTRIAFRFSFIYLSIYIFPFPLPYATNSGYLLGKYPEAWIALVKWVGGHVLGLGPDIKVLPAGLGDTIWNYVQVFCYLILAWAGTLLWSGLDRRRKSYPKLCQWFRIWVRFTLASALIWYGLDKVIPNQMHAPRLATLLEPYGDSSPEGLLWTFVGASKGFEVFTGLAETLGAVLLMLPRTTTLGALVAIADMIFVFALDMCYDVPAKLFSLHLLLLGFFLIAPDLGRLAKLFLLGDEVELVKPVPLFSRRWLNWGLLGLQVVVGLELLGIALFSNVQNAKAYGFLAPKPPLYGIWTVEEFTVDGQVRPPLLTDETLWRTVIFDYPGRMDLKVGNDTTLKTFKVQLDLARQTMALTKGDDAKSKSDFTFEQNGPGLMTLTGDLEGQHIQARLKRYDEEKFLLTSRGFHWVIE